MERDIEKSELKCALCLTPLEYAERAWLCRYGVIGGTGFVPSWPKEDLFCSAQCVTAWLDHNEPPTAKARIP